MPTANANTGNGFSKAISYALQETKKVPELLRPEVLELNQVFGSSREMGKQMREVADDRKTVKKPVLHVQINFHPDEEVTRAQAEKAIDSILKDVGIERDNHQYVMVQHNDKPHSHYHIVANRVGMDGALLNDHRIKDRLQVACDKVEREQNLRPTENRTVIYDPSKKLGYSYTKPDREKNKKVSRDKNPKISQMKNSVKREVSLALAKKEVQTPEQLKKELMKKGIDLQFLKNSSGISGASFRKDEIAMKGTAIGFKWGDIKAALESNLAQSQKSERVSPGLLKPILNEIIQKKMTMYIKIHYKPDIPPTFLADEAVRVYMRDLNPTENPWATWERHANADEAYVRLHQYAEEITRSIEQKPDIGIKPDDQSRAKTGWRR